MLRTAPLIVLVFGLAALGCAGTRTHGVGASRLDFRALWQRAERFDRQRQQQIWQHAVAGKPFANLYTDGTDLLDDDLLENLNAAVAQTRQPRRERRIRALYQYLLRHRIAMAQQAYRWQNPTCNTLEQDQTAHANIAADLGFASYAQLWAQAHGLTVGEMRELADTTLRATQALSQSMPKKPSAFSQKYRAAEPLEAHLASFLHTLQLESPVTLSLLRKAGHDTQFYMQPDRDSATLVWNGEQNMQAFLDTLAAGVRAIADTVPTFTQRLQTDPAIWEATTLWVQDMAAQSTWLQSRGLPRAIADAWEQRHALRRLLRLRTFAVEVLAALDVYGYKQLPPDATWEKHRANASSAVQPIPCSFDAFEPIHTLRALPLAGLWQARWGRELSPKVTAALTQTWKDGYRWSYTEWLKRGQRGVSPMHARHPNHALLAPTAWALLETKPTLDVHP